MTKNSIDLIRKDLLRRKIEEHFSKNPKSKSVVIKSNLGGNTFWKVSRRGNDFNIVEVITSRKEFVLSEAVPPVQPGAPGKAGGQAPGVGVSHSAGQTAQQFNVAQFSQLDLNSKMEMLKSGMIPLNIDSITMVFSDVIKPGSANNIVALRDLVQKNAAQAGVKAVTLQGFLTALSNQKKLMSGRQNVGGSITEAEEDKPTPEDSITSQPDAGLETSVEPQQPEDTKDDKDKEKPRTGEQMQLSQLVSNKPIQNLDVYQDTQGKHVVLDLAGLENSIDIVFTNTGGVKYKVGSLSRVLKPSVKSKDKE